MKEIYINDEEGMELDFENYIAQNDISDYLRFHNALDKFVWLIRLMYAPANVMKSKKYRVDELFQYYIKQNIDIEKVSKKIKGSKYSVDKFKYYLKQGWYNELALAYPFNKGQMKLGTYLERDENSWKSELFPSWLIVKAYYSMYSFNNALIFSNYDNVNTFQHRKPTNHFNETLLSKFSDLVMFYPFNIAFGLYDDNTVFRKFDRVEWQYKYAKYPRSESYNEYKTIIDIENEYYNELSKIKDDLKCKAPVNIIDLMYLFRVWANYTGNDTLVKLRKGGLLLFLEKNLFTVNFFIAGISEITAIAFLGQESFLKLFCEFYNDFILERVEIYNEWYFIPIVNRLRIYNHLSLIDEMPNNFEPPSRETISFI